MLIKRKKGSRQNEKGGEPTAPREEEQEEPERQGEAVRQKYKHCPNIIQFVIHDLMN